MIATVVKFIPLMVAPGSSATSLGRTLESPLSAARVVAKQMPGTVLSQPLGTVEQGVAERATQRERFVSGQIVIRAFLPNLGQRAGIEQRFEASEIGRRILVVDFHLYGSQGRLRKGDHGQPDQRCQPAAPQDQPQQQDSEQKDQEQSSQPNKPEPNEKSEGQQQEQKPDSGKMEQEPQEGKEDADTPPPDRQSVEALLQSLEAQDKEMQKQIRKGERTTRVRSTGWW